MTVFAPLVLPLLTGYLLLYYLTRRTDLPYKKTFCIFLSAPVGLGAVSVLTFFSYLLFTPFGPQASIILTWVILTILLLPVFKVLPYHRILPALSPQPRKAVQSFKSFLARRWPYSSLIKAALVMLSVYLFLYALNYFINFFITKSMFNLFGGWDARYFWNLKAKFLFRAPDAWKVVFSKFLIPTDYPLLLPFSVAWGWNWLGSEAIAWPAIVAFCYTFSICLGVIWYLLSFGNPFDAFIAAALLLVTRGFFFWAATQYADMPLTCFITLAVISLLAATRTESLPLYAVSGLLAGFAAFTKNEGLVFVAILLFHLALITFILHRISIRHFVRILGAFILGLTLPLIAAISIKFLAQLPGYFTSFATGTKPFEMDHPMGGFGVSTMYQVGLHMAAAKFDFTRWNVIWYVYVIAIFSMLLLKRDELRNNFDWIIITCILLIDISYFLALTITPPDLLGQTLVYSLERLTLHTSVLAIIFMFRVFSFRPVNLSQDFHKTVEWILAKLK